MTLEWLLNLPVFHFQYGNFKQTNYAWLVPNSTTRTPATDTTNGRAHKNSTTCCTTNSPPTDKYLPHPNILTCRDVGLWHCDVANLLYNCCELVRW